MESIQKKHLFVIGHARSGTTILADLLNSADNVLLLYEAHMFETYWNKNFVSDFNLHHRLAAGFKAKGKFLPSRFYGMTPEAILQAWKPHYQWVGEKVAIGPLAGSGATAAAKALDYYLSNHLDANYILTFRAPVSSLFSLRKIFPQVALGYLVQGWMLSFIELAAASYLLQRVMVVPVELMNPGIWEMIQARLEIVGRAEPHWFAEPVKKTESRTSDLALANDLAADLGWSKDQADQFLKRLSKIYTRFLECVNPETLYYYPSVSVIALIGDQLVNEIQQMLAQLSSSVASGLPTSVFSWQQGDVICLNRKVLPNHAASEQCFADIFRDRLFMDTGQCNLSAEKSASILKPEGLEFTHEEDWLRLKALPGREQHKHLTARIAIAPLCIATLRFLLRKEESSRFVMVQIGDDTGFYNSIVDCQELAVTAMVEVGSVKNLFSKIQLLPNGLIRISISGMMSSGKGSYIRIYLCGNDASIDFDDTSIALEISDLVLSSLYEDCGMDG